MSIYRTVILVLAILLSPGLALAMGRPLTFVGRIGSGWATGKSGWMSFVAFSPDGRAIASDAAAAPDDLSTHLTIWTFPGGRLIKQLPIFPDAISPDWRYAASPRSVVEMATGRPVISLGADDFELHAFSPGGRFVAETAHGPKAAAGRIRILALPSGKQVRSFGRLIPSSIAISPDGASLASGHWQAIKIWNMHTGERIAVLRGLSRYVEGLSFSRNGRLLAASDGGKLQIWDLRTRRLIRTVDLQAFGSTPVFSPDGRLIAVGAYGTGMVSLVDIRLGRVIDRYKVSDLGCGSAAFSPDGRYLVTPSTGGLIKWPYDRGGTIRVFRVRSPPGR